MILRIEIAISNVKIENMLLRSQRHLVKIWHRKRALFVGSVWNSLKHVLSNNNENAQDDDFSWTQPKAYKITCDVLKRQFGQLSPTNI